VDRVSEALLPLHEAIAPQSRSATVNYVDETTWHRHGVLAWVWVMANPSAEWALRFTVLWRRVMQGTYNDKGDRGVGRILSVRETCRLRGIPTFPILVEAVTYSFNGQPPDVSRI
jgi:hypothetical protein